LENQPSKGVFLNGKQQVIDMLRFMNAGEKSRLLKAIEGRNAPLARELMQKSISFQSLCNLNDEDLIYSLNFIKPELIGIVLKILKKSDQQRILGISNREYAESAYKVFTTSLRNEERDITRATERIAEILGKLHSRNQITIK